MTLNIDTSRALRTAAQRRALIEAIRDADEHESEPDWVEWKRAIDLQETRWQFELGRQILGFRNRDPARAALHLEGCGYVVAGAHPGALPGVSPIDAADLETGISQYVGADGPEWDAHYETVDEKTILVITVEPPRPGDPLFSLAKGYGTTRAGAVYVRKHGKTEQADPASVRMLSARAAAGTRGPQLAIDVAPIRPPLRVSPVLFDEEALQEWLESERVSLLAGVPRGGVRASAYGFAAALGDHRSADGYRAEVEEYLAQVYAHLRPLVRAAAVMRGLGAVALAVENKSPDNFERVAVDLEVRGSVWAFMDADDAESDVEFPDRPRRWGTSYLGLLPTRQQIIYPAAAQFARGHAESDLHGARISTLPLHVRPGPDHLEPLETFSIIVDASHAGDTLTLYWRATASNVSGATQGEIPLEVSQEPVTPLSLLYHDEDDELD